MMKVDLKGRINNIPLSPSDGLLPLFEAVVNSIQAIEDRQNAGEDVNGEIIVTIHRSEKYGQQELESGIRSLPPIIGFSIKDNGIGFNQINFDSFNTSDSTYKHERGGKGVGHFSWAKVFDITHIRSVFVQDGKHLLREFDFTINNSDEQVHSEKLSEVDDDIYTIVHLDGFKEEYRIDTKSYKRGKTIAIKILNHCLSYYITKSVPKIIVCDSDYLSSGDETDTTIDLNTLYKSEIEKNIFSETINIGHHKFQLLHLKHYKAIDETHHISYCGNKRVVLEENIPKFFWGNNLISDEFGKFVYILYVSSPYLDNAVDQSRTQFTIPRKNSLNEYNVRCLPEGDPSFDQIQSSLSSAIERYLAEYLKYIIDEKKKLVERYLTNINPAHRHTYLSCEDEILSEISLGMSDEKIAKVIYKYKGIAEHKILEKTRQILNSREQEKIDLQTDVESTIEKLEDVQKTGLAEYVVYRYKLLQLLQKKLELNNDGKYVLESEIHDIIFPRKTDSRSLGNRDHNLWVLDDRLSFHTYATSDLELKKISDSDSDKRPDVLIFTEGYENTVNSVTIVEFKRPSRDDKDILDQIFEYMDHLQNRKIKTSSGRTINTTNQTIYYCYAICDFNASDSAICKLVKRGDFKELVGGLGYYTYNNNYNAHIEILSYDQLLPDAKKRNQIWFEKLGLPYQYTE